jgi:DNA-binding transcriptional ArsR family regulator
MNVVALPELDPVLHAPARLRVVTVLLAGPHGDPSAFAELQSRLGLTAGNLSTHLRKLEEAGYVAVDKVFRDRVPTTSVSLTETGRRAHAAYAAAMTSYLDGSALVADDAHTTTEATP